MIGLRRVHLARNRPGHSGTPVWPWSARPVLFWGPGRGSPRCHGRKSRSGATIPRRLSRMPAADPPPATRSPHAICRRAASRCSAPSGHLAGAEASDSQLSEYRGELAGAFHCFGAICRRETIRTVAAKTDAPHLRSTSRGLGTVGDHLPLVLSDGRQDVQRHRVACGLSTATNSTPKSIKPAINAKLRDSRRAWR